MLHDDSVAMILSFERSVGVVAIVRYIGPCRVAGRDDLDPRIIAERQYNLKASLLDLYRTRRGHNSPKPCCPYMVLCTKVYDTVALGCGFKVQSSKFKVRTRGITVYKQLLFSVFDG